MTKSILTILLLLMLAKDLSAQTTRTLFNPDYLRGKIAKILEIELADKDYKDTIIKTATLFDKNGTTTERTLSYGKVSYILKYVTAFDSRGNKISTNLTNAEGDIISFIYDDRGRLEELRGKLKNKSSSYRDVYSYNNKNNQTEENHYNAKDSLSSNTSFKYNAQNHLIEEDYYIHSIFSYKVLYTYLDFDDFGNWTKRASKTIFQKTKMPAVYKLIERQISYQKG